MLNKHMSLDNKRMQHNRNIPIEYLNDELVSITPYIRLISELYIRKGVDIVSRPHRLNFNAIIYITDGKGVHYIDHRMHLIGKGSLLTLSKGQVHRFTPERQVEGYLITFDDNFLSFDESDCYAPIMRAALESINCQSNKNSHDTQRLFELLQSESNQPSEFSSEIVKNLMRSLILKEVVPQFKLEQNKANIENNLNYYRLKQYIEQHFSSRPSVQHIAQQLGKSNKQLNKLAVEHSGDSVKKLIEQRTLLEAKRLLAYSHLSIAEIANQLGFHEATNMTKFFKRHTNINPRDFRQLCHYGLK